MIDYSKIRFKDLPEEDKVHVNSAIYSHHELTLKKEFHFRVEIHHDIFKQMKRRVEQLGHTLPDPAVGPEDTHVSEIEYSNDGQPLVRYVRSFPRMTYSLWAIKELIKVLENDPSDREKEINELIKDAATIKFTLEAAIVECQSRFNSII
jgi:hypothetical protein